MSNNKTNSLCSSSFSAPPKKKRKNSYSSSYSPVTYILGKRRREEEISSSDSSAQSIMWNPDWDEPYLDLLDRVCLGQFPGMKVFSPTMWRRFAQVLGKQVNSNDFDGNDCKHRGERFRDEFNKMDKSNPSPTPRELKLRSIFRLVPRFPKGCATRGNFREVASEALEGSSSTATGSSSRRSRPISSPWMTKLIDALTYLVTHHRLRIDLMGAICAKFHKEMALCFVKLSPSSQMEQLNQLMGSCSSALLTTQPFPFSPSADCTQPFQFSPLAD